MPDSAQRLEERGAARTDRAARPIPAAADESTGIAAAGAQASPVGAARDPARDPRTVDAPRAQAAGEPRVSGGGVLSAISVASAVFFLAHILTYGYGRDQGIYAMVARTLLNGGMPYRDAFDFKPPGIFLVFALARALFGSAEWGIRILEVAGLVATAVAMARLAERWWGDRRIGLIGAALTILVHAQLDFWHTAQPESFGGMLTIFALLAASPRSKARGPAPDPVSASAPVDLPHVQRSTGHDGCTSGPASARTSPGPLRLIASGALFGLAGLLKPPLAGGGAALAFVLGWPALRDLACPLRRASQLADALGPRELPQSGTLVRGALRPAALIALGGALPIAACLLWFAAKGALADLYQVLFVFTPPYTALGWQGVTVLGLSWYAFAEWLCRYSGPMALGLGCLLALHPAPPERRGVAVLVGVIAVQLAGVVMQAKFFPYHYGAIWPATGMLAALGLWKAWDHAVRRGRLAASILVAGFALVAFARSATKDVPDSYIERCLARISVFARGARDQAELDRLASVADVNAGANRAVAAFLRERVAPGAPVFIWGFEPIIYDLADRPPSTRYLYNVPQRVAWAKHDARADLMRDLAARPPAAIVVERRDVFPMVTGDVLDSHDALEDFPALAGLISRRYEAAISIEDFDVFLARDEAPRAE